MKTYFNLKKGIYVVIACVIAAISFSFTQNITPDEPDCHIIIDASQPQLQLSPDMYGIFFEDINHASDGGLYGELIQNRDFEAGRIPENMKFIANDTIQNSVGWKEHYVRPTSLYSWNMIKEGEWEGSAEQTDAVPLNPGNPNYMKFEVTKTGKGRIAVSNNGYWGISLKKGEKYSLSLYAFKDAASKGEVKVSLESKTGKVYTSIVISGISASWKRFSALLTSNADDTSACFVLSPLSKGVINFDVISLFPQKTFNNRKYGLRNDLAQMLKDMKPSFIRFPGGCVVEGASVENRIQWKKTIGGISERPGHWNLWGYHTYDGIGFHDYLQLCEDLNAEPLYVVNVGMACQYRGGEFDKGEVRKYINETLDALEYAMGPVTSKWGAIRAKNGHPKIGRAHV